MKCENCGEEIIGDWRKDRATRKKPLRFCSRSCSNKRKFTPEQNKKKGGNRTRKRYYCNICGKETTRKTKTGLCSECFHKSPIFGERVKNGQHKSNKKMGGFRRGSGRSKHGYYKGIYCGSTYELVWVIYQLDHNISFRPFNSMLELGDKKYIPDFVQNGNIVEIKGYKNDNWYKQLEVAKHNGWKVKTLFREDLKKEFDYVTTNYGVSENNLEILYDKAH